MTSFTEIEKYCKLQIKNMPNMLSDLKKIMFYCLNYSNLFMYLNLQFIDLQF